ncbi:protein of unknown function [Methylococcus capsulatus]|uniref:Uncharacterized protein n=1 Tax=Methylococcus capsulatus TaxID=414 RepID=A0AA35Y1M7_METCP|nr:protein of unknown function [Methylococcus capsulatus]
MGGRGVFAEAMTGQSGKSACSLLVLVRRKSEFLTAGPRGSFFLRIKTRTTASSSSRITKILPCD